MKNSHKIKSYTVLLILFFCMQEIKSQTSYAYNFENATINETTFTWSGYNFSIASSNSDGGPFTINNYNNNSVSLHGWNGSSSDSYYIDNENSVNVVGPASFTIALTSPISSINLKSFWLYVGDVNEMNISTGTVTITGYNDASQVFQTSQNGGWNNNANLHNGFTLIDLSSFGGNDNSNKNITSFRIASDNNIAYLALDELIWTNSIPPTVSSITALNTLSNNLSSEQYSVVFSKNVTGVDASDFTLVSTGSVSSAGISVTPVSASTYTVTVNSVTGDGTLRLDLNSSGTGITDAAGNAISSGYSSGNVYTIRHTAPVISSVTLPANATYITGQNLDFTLNLSEAVTVNTSGGTPYLSIGLNTGGTVHATYLSGSGTAALVFRYTVVGGNSDDNGISMAPSITLNGATIQDAVTNNLIPGLNNVPSSSSILVKTATILPTLTSPSTANYGRHLSISFILPEAFALNSVKLIFIGTGSTNTISLSNAPLVVGTNSFILDTKSLNSSIYFAAASNGSTLSPDTYTVAVSFQDIYGNPASNAFASNVIINNDTYTWTGASSTSWTALSNWNTNEVPDNTINTIIAVTANQPLINTSQQINNLTINSGASLTINNPGVLTVNGLGTNNGTITVAPGGSLINSSAISNVTLQENVIAQRGWRVFGNPFTTIQTLSNLAATNGITIGTPGTGITDTRLYNNANNTWANNIADISANSLFGLFIRGLSSEVTGLNYLGGPSAFTFSMTGSLNPNSVSRSQSTSYPFRLISNPYAAPVNTQALTGGVALPYYTYQIIQGGSQALQQTKAGSWVSHITSSTSTTIPVLGVLAYTPTSSSSFNIGITDLNTGASLQTGLFGEAPTNAALELVVEQAGIYQDKLFIRQDKNASANGIDPIDLQKFTNDVVNVYTITPDQKHMAIDARNQLADPIPLGISATAGDYNFSVNSNTLPTGTTVYLKDNLLHTQTALTTGTKYHFSIQPDSTSQGEQRFVLVFSSNTNIVQIADSIPTFSAKVLGNLIKGNSVQVEIAGSATPIMIVVKDMNGKTVSATTAVNGTNTLSLGNSNPGMQLIQISNGTTTLTEKIIKL